ncbi:hypothetical protein CFE70_005807 [Pyrenophora teres f. teres 0-1]
MFRGRLLVLTRTQIQHAGSELPQPFYSTSCGCILYVPISPKRVLLPCACLAWLCLQGSEEGATEWNPGTGQEPPTKTPSDARND